MEESEKRHRRAAATRRSRREPERVGASLGVLAEAPPDLFAPDDGKKTAPCYGCGERRAPVAVVGGLRYRGLCARCEAAAAAELEERERAEAREGIMRRAGFTPLQEGWTLGTYLDGLGAGQLGEAAKALARGREWLEGYRAGERRNLLLYGTVGSGKTGLAVAVAKDLVEDVVGVRFVVLRELLHDMVERISRGLPAGDPGLYDVAVLVLDDLGAERPTNYARNELAVLVERRYQARLPIIATSNYDPDALADRLGHDDPVVGQRIVSRLSDRALMRRFKGEDRRG